jgi:integrase
VPVDLLQTISVGASLALDGLLRKVTSATHHLGGSPAVIGEDRILPPDPGRRAGVSVLKGGLKGRASRRSASMICVTRLRPGMMNGGDLYELAKILGHSNIEMTERYAKLARQHIARIASTAREIWKLMKQQTCDETNSC